MNALETAACKLIGAYAAHADAAVELRLLGKINLARLALDLRATALSIERNAGIQAVALDVTGINLGEALPGATPELTHLSREEIERGAIRALLQDEHLWGMDGEQETIARLFFELKEAVRANRPVEHLVELIQLSPLIDKVREATRQKSGPTSVPGPAGEPAVEVTSSTPLPPAEPVPA